MADGFEEILARFDPEVRNLAIGARALIEAVYPRLSRYPGKSLRHTKITTPEDLEQPALRTLVEAAAVHRLATRP
jgi:hypothetical protein